MVLSYITYAFQIWWSCNDFNWLWYMLICKRCRPAMRKVLRLMCSEWESTWWLVAEKHKPFRIKGNRILKMLNSTFLQEILLWNFPSSIYFYSTNTSPKHELKCSLWVSTIEKLIPFEENFVFSQKQDKVKEIMELKGNLRVGK